MVLVTGATGFVGREICRNLLSEGHKVRAGVRNKAALVQANPDMDVIEIGDIGPRTEWQGALTGVDAVVHLAARVHVIRERASNPLEAFRSVNVAGTERLAQAGVDAGVQRLVYVSSIKVNGERTGHGEAFSEADIPAPQDPYGVSKWEAEQALCSVANKSALEIVIVRPPLVYGPGVGGNFARLLDWVACGVPLPLASVHNRRSLVYLGNLVDALVTCVTHPNAQGNTYVVSDGEEVSTPELIQQVARAMGKRPPLFPTPEAALRMLAMLTGKSAEVSRLVDSLVLNSSKIRADLGWRPPYSLTEGLRPTVAWYQQNRNTDRAN